MVTKESCSGFYLPATGHNDVSRWRRFQDADESAHYEFLCKNAGVPIHYCAELFPNDGSLPSSIFKALKRTMAAEYSRELGVKVFNAQKRLVELMADGFDSRIWASAVADLC